MSKNKSEILSEKDDESVSFPLEMDFKPELKGTKKKEYVIALVTATKVIASDSDGNGVDFPKEDFIDPKIGDKFQA